MRAAAVFWMAAALVWAGPARGGLLARVDPAWSPFVRMEVPGSMRALAAEARELLPRDPARVARVLETELSETAAPPVALQGLLADALYLAGGDRLWAAERRYRGLLKGELPAEAAAWCRFMAGSVRKGLGFPEVAETDYRQALEGAAEPWRAALRFDLAALLLETGRPAEAAGALEAWVRDYPRAAGRALALYLLGEARVRTGEGRAALEAFERAYALDPEAWKARPETGRMMARALKDAGRVERAVEVLERVADAFAGTPEADRALLEAGRIWEGRGEVARAARTYAVLLDRGAGAEAAREARLRLALLGVEHADTVELTEPFPAYRIFYRPRPTLEELAAGRDAATAQRAVRGLADLAYREGAVEESLRLLARAFQAFPESAESGRAYEAFMDRLERWLAELARDDPARAVAVYDAFSGPAGWVPTRDLGAIVLPVAEACEALGAPGAARALYEELLRRASRVLPREEVERRVLRARARAGDPAALDAWARQNPGDWRAQLARARRLADQGRAQEAAAAYRAAERAAPDRLTRYRIRAEADRLGRRAAPTASLLAAWEARARLWRAAGRPGDLPPPDPRVAARLRFALGRHREALRAFAGIAEPGPDDRFLLSMARWLAGDREGARAEWASLAAGEDPFYAALARTQDEVRRLIEEGGGGRE